LKQKPEAKLVNLKYYRWVYACRIAHSILFNRIKRPLYVEREVVRIDIIVVQRC
jgi:hypothetical protein